MSADAFGKLKSSMNKGIATISVKASSSLEKSKLKTHMETLTKEMVQLHTEIGKEFYTMWDSGTTDHTPLQEKLERVRQINANLASLEEQLASIDERDSQILGGGPAKPQEPEITGFFCSQCGAHYETEVRFCRKCGNPMQK